MTNAHDENDQAFLLKLSDALRAQTSVEAIGHQATQLIAQRLAADRVYLVSLNPNDDTVLVTQETRRQDMPPLRGTYRSSDFPAAIQEIFDRTIVYTDVRTDARLTELDRLSFAGLGAVGFIAASLRQGDQTMIWAAGAVSTQPRSWTAGEVALFEDAVERTWAAVERARVEAALRKSEEKYRTLFNSIDEGVATIEVIVDQAGQAVDLLYLEHNPALLQQTGITGSIIGKRASELFPDLEPFWLETYERVARTGQSERFDYPIAALDRWFEVYISRVGEEGSRINVAVYNNITERKRAAEKQAFLLKLSDALRPLSDPLAVQEAACRVLGEHLVANRVLYAETLEGTGMPALVRATDYTNGVPSRVGWHQLDDYGTFVTEIWRAGRNLLWNSLDDLPDLPPAERAAYEAVEIEAIIGVPLVKDGRFIAFLAVHQATPRHWRAHEIALVEETVERTWAAVERAKAEEALREADRRKDEFLAMLAHELRNPLAPVRNGIQLLAQTHQDDQILGTMLPIMNRQMDHLMRMVDDLLDVSRISRGRIELRNERIDLTQVVGQAVAAMHPLYTASGRQLSAQLPDHSLYLDGDATRLSQVVTNLLSNGLRYTHEGGQVWLSLAQLGEQALLRVRDNGIGLATDQLEAIFELFVQVDKSLARSHGGLGLGLSLVQELVQMHGGRVEAHSPGLEQGSEFVVYLPILVA